MVAFPPCKINLGLHIVARRADGYHDLETVFYPVPWTDVVEAIPANQFTFSSSGLEVSGDSADNLCVRAFQLLKQEFGLPNIQLHLHKVIPMGAGLGGGSADAAYVLRLLNNLFSLNLSATQLMEYASRLGSDCAFFVQDEAMLGTGRGEKLEQVTVSLKGWHLLIVKPPVHVSTREAYAKVRPAAPVKPLRQVLALPVEKWKDELVNDFEISVFRQFPAIAQLRDQLYTMGAVYAAMSGSGAAVYGLFEDAIGLPDEWRTLPHWQGKLSV